MAPPRLGCRIVYPASGDVRAFDVHHEDTETHVLAHDRDSDDSHAVPLIQARLTIEERWKLAWALLGVG